MEFPKGLGYREQFNIVSSLSNSPISVLNLCETARGGVGTYLVALNRMPTALVTHQIIAPEQHADFLRPTIKPRTFDNPRRGLRSIWSMIRVLLAQRRKQRPDVYFFHSTFALAGLAMLRLMRDRTPAIYCAHGWAITNYPRGSLKERVVRIVEGRLCGLADVVLNVSSAEKRLAEEHGYPGCHVVIENAVSDVSGAVDGTLFFGEPGAIHLLFVGRFDRQKGIDLLLPAFASAHAQNPDLRLSVIGGAVRGDEEPPVFPDGATSVGWVGPDEIDRWYASADALVVPSRWEGLPLVIPEALRNGTPVLCSDQSGMDELVTPETGQCFSLDVVAMSKCLAGLDKSQLRAMRPACRASYEARFTLERLHSEVHKLLAKLTAVNR